MNIRHFYINSVFVGLDSGPADFEQQLAPDTYIKFDDIESGELGLRFNFDNSYSREQIELLVQQHLKT